MFDDKALLRNKENTCLGIRLYEVVKQYRVLPEHRGRFLIDGMNMSVLANCLCLGLFSQPNCDGKNNNQANQGNRRNSASIEIENGLFSWKMVRWCQAQEQNDQL